MILWLFFAPSSQCWNTIKITVEGLNKEAQISNTLHLDGANPAYIATATRCQRTAVRECQQKI